MPMLATCRILKIDIRFCRATAFLNLSVQVTARVSTAIKFPQTTLYGKFFNKFSETS